MRQRVASANAEYMAMGGFESLVMPTVRVTPTLPVKPPLPWQGIVHQESSPHSHLLHVLGNGKTLVTPAPHDAGKE